MWDKIKGTAGSIFPYLRNRLGEASTWRGVIAVFSVLGYSLSPENIEKIVIAGVSLSGAIGVFFPDKKKK